MQFPVVIQHRHVHLSEKDFKRLFGDVAPIQLHALGHHGQYVCEQTVDVVGVNGVFEGVRVLGPMRETTQVELAASDAFALGLDAPVRISGDLSRTASCKLKGPLGEIEARSSTIIPARHLHVSEQTAKKLGLEHHGVVELQCGSKHIEQVSVRVHPTFANELHVSADEAAQLWLQSGDMVQLC